MLKWIKKKKNWVVGVGQIYLVQQKIVRSDFVSTVMNLWG
jgi:hypothetical protein